MAERSPDVHPLDQHHVAPIFAANECESIISAAEAHADGDWPCRGEYLGHRTIDVDALELATLQPWLLQAVQERALVLLASLFGVTDLRIASLRVVKYDAATQYDALPLHSDGSSLSFVCALNACAGGGTYVRALRRVLTPAVGHALLFCGRWLHAGVRVESGVRYVLAGFCEATLPPMTQRALARVVAVEQRASAARRLCPRQHWLRREFCADGASAERACSSCAAAVPADAARHCCAAEGCCGTRWCDTCLDAAEASAEESVEASEAAEEPLSSVAAAEGQVRSDGLVSEFVADVTMPDGVRVAPGRTVRKVWRLQMHWDGEGGDSGGGGGGEGGEGGGGGGNAAWWGADPRRRPRLVRGDYDSDESICSRCLGDTAITPVTSSDTADDDDTRGYAVDLSARRAVLVDVAVELVTPRRPGAYRIFFRLLVGTGERIVPVTGCDELFVDFVVVESESGPHRA